MTKASILHHFEDTGILEPELLQLFVKKQAELGISITALSDIINLSAQTLQCIKNDQLKSVCQQRTRWKITNFIRGDFDKECMEDSKVIKRQKASRRRRSAKDRFNSEISRLKRTFAMTKNDMELVEELIRHINAVNIHTMYLLSSKGLNKTPASPQKTPLPKSKSPTCRNKNRSVLQELGNQHQMGWLPPENDQLEEQDKKEK